MLSTSRIRYSRPLQLTAFLLAAALVIATMTVKQSASGNFNPKSFRTASASNGDQRFTPHENLTENSSATEAQSSASSGLGPEGTVNAVAVSGNDVYVGGSFTTVGGIPVKYLAKWDGTNWSALGSGVNGQVNALAISGNGELYVGGNFTTAGGLSANRIAKWNGSSWSAIGAGFNGSVLALAISGDDIYAGGTFSLSGGASIAKWDGSSWSSVGTGTNGAVNAVTLSGFNVYAGGNFMAAGGKPAMRIARWGIFGWFALGSGIDTAGSNSEVNTILLSGGNVYAGGNFTTAGGASAPNLAIWNGSSWSSFGSGANGPVRALSLSGNGDIYAGGGFTNVAGVSANRIAKWNGSGWSPFSSGMNGQVNALAVAGNGDVYAGGSFTTAGGKPASNIARWNGTVWSDLVRSTVPSQAADISFANVRPYHMDVSWTKGNGHGRVVKINTVNSFTAPADGSDPPSDSNYGGSGEQVVYNGNGNAVTVTGLSPGTTYYFRVYEYNNYGPYTIFNTGTAANNPNSQATLPCSLATMVVNTNDSGPGSLRQAIVGDVCPGSTIGFDPSVFATPQTITLTSGQLVIDKNLTIQGPGANLLSISGNNASRIFSVNGGVTATLDGMTISNAHDYYAGGGIYNGGTVTLSNSTVTGNTADFGYGGGIYNDGTLTIGNTTVNGNTANGYYDWWYDWYYGGSGGGIWNNGGTLIIANSTVSENTAYSEYGDSVGGGIFNSSGNMTVINSTVTGNSSYATTCGGIVGYGNETFLNTIVALNVDGDICDEIETASHNLIGGSNGTSGGIANGVNGNIVGVDPLLGPLQNNSGPTRTHALSPGSPAINAGDQCVLTENGCGFTHAVLTTDQRGMSRNGTVDIGAFEAQGMSAPATITVMNTNDAGPGSLRQALSDIAPGGTIKFDSTAFAAQKTITLTSGQLVIDKNLTINGPGASLLSVSANNLSRVFYINSGITAAINGFTIRDAMAGGIYNSGMLTITNSTISGNRALWEGGGVFNSGTLAVTNSTISFNIGDAFGGGISNSGTLILTNSNIAGNQAFRGGGILNNGGHVTITNSTITENSTFRDSDQNDSAGGGIFNGSGTLTVTNSTISGNSAVGWGSGDFGGGIANFGGLVVSNVTISGNTAIVGGGINSFGSDVIEQLTNTIVAGNGGQNGKEDIFGTIETASHNLIGDAASSGGIQHGVNGNIVGVNPMLGPLQDNGGPTMTHALLAGSPAINAGSNCVLTVNGCGDGNPALPTDQRGMPRVGTVDIGAFESQVSGPPPPRKNFALAANGGVAAASSEYNSGYSPSGANNGDRKGLNWGSGGGWNDATAGTYPDVLEIALDGTKLIDEVDVFTVQDNYASPVDPAESTTFTAYGVTGFDVQYWNGSGWVTVQNGSIANNNKVWTKLTFSPVATAKIRVMVNAALSSYSRITEVEAWGEDADTPPPPRTNFALTSNGGVASASSVYSGAYPVSGTTDGDRSGLNWGSGGGWNDATAGSYPDLLQIDFDGAKTIDEIDVFTVQDSYWSPSPPTADMTFSQYGITEFNIQYWSGSDWVTVPNGAIANNNKVWTKVTFPSLTTNKIRVQVNNSLASYSRIAEVEAWGGVGGPPPPPRTNFALATEGGVASASSEYSGVFPVTGTNNGDRKGSNWGAGGGWNDATAGTYPDFLQINFSGAKTIDEIDVFTVQDAYGTPVEPALADTFTQYGITHFDVQYWNGSAWATVPGGSVTGNNKVWTQISFPAVTTDKIRVQVNNSLASFSRIVELEAWGPTPP